MPAAPTGFGSMRLRASALLLLSLAVLPGFAGAAFAHASLIAAEPRDGSTVPEPPRTMLLRFNEPVSPLAMRLIAPDGRALEDVVGTVRNEAVDVRLPADATQWGTYVLSWRVVSLDGHPVGGSVVFSVGQPSRSGPGVPVSDVDRRLQAAIWAARFVLYLGLSVGIGGAVFIAWVASGHVLPKGVPRLLAASLWAGIAATVLSVGLQGSDALATPLSGLGQPAVWAAGLRTSFGITAAAAVAALLSAAFSIAKLGPRQAKVLSAMALIGAGAALAASGHASTAQPQWLTRPAVFVHTVGVVLWIGALLPLGVILANGAAGTAAVLRRFSTLIVPVVILLASAGLTLAVVQLDGSVVGLWSTAYGRVFLAKLVALLLLFGLAALNRYRLTPNFTDRARGAGRIFGRSIAAEGVLVLVIFGLVAIWRFTPPPRAPASAGAAPAAVHMHTAEAMAEVVLAPGRAGRARAAISLRSGDAGPLPAREVTLTIANPSAGIEPIARKASPGPEDTWTVEDLAIPVAGQWQVHVDALITDFDKVALEGTVAVRP